MTSTRTRKANQLAKMDYLPTYTLTKHYEMLAIGCVLDQVGYVPFLSLHNGGHAPCSKPHSGGMDLSLARACWRFVYSPTYEVCKLAAPSACNASSVTGPIRAIRFYSQMQELQPPVHRHHGRSFFPRYYGSLRFPYTAI